jgi:hypothetical protein
MDVQLGLGQRGEYGFGNGFVHFSGSSQQSPQSAAFAAKQK